MKKIGKMLFERTAVAHKPRQVIEDSLSLVREEGRLTTSMILKNPYVVDFLDLPHGYTENQLETAILNEIEKFILELGSGFSFVARQKRLSIGADDFYVDLIFFNRHLKRLVVVELKTTKFKPAHKGQMEFYLRWLNKNERCEGEGAPIGIILCTEKDQEQIQVFDLEESSIHVAEYLTFLPPKEVFERKIQEALLISKEAGAIQHKTDEDE